ncbi:MAG: M3 family metallopeptidase, partial [Bacteroidota bacterium]
MNEALSLRPDKTAAFLPQEFEVTVWSRLKPYYTELLTRSVNTLVELEQWIADRSELNLTLEEEVNRRYAILSVDVGNEKAAAAYNYLIQEVLPRTSSINHQLNKRLLQSPFCALLDRDQYGIYLRTVRSQIKRYEQKNLELLAKIKVKTQRYGQLFGQMTIVHEGKEYTIGAVRKLLESPDRDLRKQIYLKTADQLLTKKEVMETLFDNLLKMRHQVAQNAGFVNYRDYRFEELERFAYTPEDCKRFHQVVRSEVLPLYRATQEQKRQELDVDRLRPWDLQAVWGNPH